MSNIVKLPPTPEQSIPDTPWSRDLIKSIAMDIGKEVVAYIEVQYPEAVKATSSTFKLSVRNCIYNQIMAAIEVNDAGQIAARLADRKKRRRKWTADWRKIRKERFTSP
jgi:hypothetical protein